MKKSKYKIIIAWFYTVGSAEIRKNSSRKIDLDLDIRGQISLLHRILLIMRIESLEGAIGRNDIVLLRKNVNVCSKHLVMSCGYEEIK